MTEQKQPSVLLLSPSCALWGPFSPSHLFICPLAHATNVKCSKGDASPSTRVFLTLKTDRRTHLTRSSGPEGWSCHSRHLSGCPNILKVVYHMKDAPRALAAQMRSSFLLGNSLEVPCNGAAGLVGNRAPSKALSRNIFGWLVGFSHQFLRAPVLHLL